MKEAPVGFPRTRGSGGEHGPALGRGWVLNPGDARPRPGCAGARRGRFVPGKPSGFASKRETPQPQTAPAGRKWMESPSRPLSPPPPPSCRSPAPSFGAVQSFGVNEKSLRKDSGGAGSHPPPPRRSHLLDSPRCCRFSPLPAQSTKPGRQKGARGQLLTGSQLVPLPKRLRERLCKGRGNFHQRKNFLKNKIY